MKKQLAGFTLRLTVFLLFTVYCLLFAAPVRAVCPVCTVAVGGGLLISHYLGVDDLIAGVWIGGLTLSLGLWTGSALKRKYFKYQEWFWTAGLWIMTIFGLKQAGFIGQPTCKIHGHDKLLSGIVFGTIAFVLGFLLDLLLRKMNKTNKGKALFPYQKVISPLIFLVLASVFSAQLCRLGLKP